jgi:hypothetical protein
MDKDDRIASTVLAHSAKEKSDLIDSLFRTGHTIVGINDNGNGTFTIFYSKKGE